MAASAGAVRAGAYPCIWAWGKMMGSSSGYISDQIERARREKAPKNATFRQASDGAWATYDETVSNRWTAQTRSVFEGYLKQLAPEMVIKD